MSSSPMLIRSTPVPIQTQPHHHHHHHRHHNAVPAPKTQPPPISPSSSPDGKSVYGTTPGGSRIVYSREQLLTLASSPLSAHIQSTFPLLPNEISRSPEKDSFVVAPHRRANGSPTRSGQRSTSQHRSGVPGALNGHGAGLARSPPGPHSPTNVTAGASAAASKPRSPGSAFNFSKGPISPTAHAHNNSFKERLEAASAAAAK